MRVTGQPKRLRLTHTRTVKIPERLRFIFWDEPGDEVILEKFILRILNYGHFEDIKWLYENYPDETYQVSMKYPDIKRGVRFWIRFWREKGLKD